MSRSSARRVPGWRRLVPGLATLLDYRRAWLPGDLLAGVTVAAYLVPQVMAYAGVAGLPRSPVCGRRPRARRRPGFLALGAANPGAGALHGFPVSSSASGTALPPRRASGGRRTHWSWARWHAPCCSFRARC
ncbi:SulP family inorganic anion transporter [Streptomyces sp. NPDC102259]|uniref:SulP family inorganic anion transporter n=1 Tax=Streptomyces sp. NPDC102259 TaxID=3366148 RepID=UPI0037F7A020